jgi:hypothetical protein
MADQVIKGINPVPGLTPYIVNTSSSSTFIQKTFRSARTDGGFVDFNTAGGQQTIYTVQDGQVFILIKTKIAGRVGTASTTGDQTFIGLNSNGVTGLNLDICSVPATIGAIIDSTQTFNPPIIMFPGDKINGAANTHAYERMSVLGFVIDKFEWDKFINTE